MHRAGHVGLRDDARCRRSDSAATSATSRRSRRISWPRTPTTIDSIVMIGDSITVASTAGAGGPVRRAGLRRRARSRPWSASGSPCRRPATRAACKVADFITGADGGDSDGQLWIVALGTNDINQYGSPDEIAARRQRDARRRPRRRAARVGRHVLPRRAGGCGAGQRHRRRPAVAPRQLGDGAVERVRRRRRGLRSDGVHPTEAGTVVFADVVGATIDEFLDR